MPVPITAREPLKFTPPTLPEALTGEDATQEKKFFILVRVPTMMERDTYNAALIRGGVVNYTRKQIREMALAGVQELFAKDGEEAIAAMVALLEEYWLVQDEEQRVQIEQLRVLGELSKAAADKGDEPPDPAEVKKALDEIKPEVVMDRSRKVDALALSNDVSSRYQPVREALAAVVEQDAKRAWMNVEVYVGGWHGLEHTADGNGRGGLLKHEIEYLRQQIGEEAFLETSDFITALMGINEDEEKNLASLLESMSAPIGSPADTSKASSADGNSTDGSSTETPGTESPKTTGPSSGSSRSSTTKTETRKSGRTGDQSSTSQ